MGLMRYNFEPLTKISDLSLLERSVRVFTEEFILLVKASARCELNGVSGTLKLGGGPWHRIVFVPDDPFYLGRCFLDFSPQQEAEREFHKLAERLQPQARDDTSPQPAETEPEDTKPSAVEDARAEGSPTAETPPDAAGAPNDEQERNQQAVLAALAALEAEPEWADRSGKERRREVIRRALADLGLEESDFYTIAFACNDLVHLGVVTPSGQGFHLTGASTD